MNKQEYIDAHAILVCSDCFEKGQDEKAITRLVDYAGTHVDAQVDVKCISCGHVDGKLMPAMTSADHWRAQSLED